MEHAIRLAQAGPRHGEAAPREVAPSGGETLDLTSGKVDVTPLRVRPATDFMRPEPLAPPRTVEGTLVSVSPEGDVATVRTERYGEVKIGLPPDIEVIRKGQESSVEAMEPGDRVWATVETLNGVRAYRLVFAPPANPLISYIGIPVLLLIALAIWWTGRNRGEVLAGPKAPARPAS